MADPSKISDECLLDAFHRQIAKGIGSDPSCIFLGHIDPGSSDESTLFLRNFASLLNSGGGVILLGMDEGLSPSAAGMARPAAEGICKGLISIIEDSLDPPPPKGAYSVRFVDMPEDRCISVFEISSSEHRPHAIGHVDGSLTFLKQDGGIHPLRASDLRLEMLGSPGVRDVEDHIKRRVWAISAGRGKVPLISTGKVIVHIVPELFERGMLGIRPARIMEGLSDFEWAEGEWLEVIDGYLGYYSDYSYVHLGNNGSLEAVESFKMMPKRGGEMVLDLLLYQNDIARIIRSYQDALSDVDLAPKLFFSLSLANVLGYKMGLRMRGKHTKFLSDVLNLPPRPLATKCDHDGVMTFVNSFLDILWHGSGVRPR